MNIIILILMCVTAYLLNELLSYADRKFDEWQYKKQLNNDLYRFKVKKILNACKNHCLDCGYSRVEAERYAIRFINELRKTNQINEKYKLLKEGA